jgi:hypothetical protein
MHQGRFISFSINTAYRTRRRIFIIIIEVKKYLYGWPHFTVYLMTINTDNTPTSIDLNLYNRDLGV